MTRALLARAAAELQAGRRDAAESLYRRILAEQPDQAEATHFLGVCLVQGGRIDEGVELMRRSLALDPAQPVYRQNLAFALVQAGRSLQRRGAWHAARAPLEQAAALSPGDDSILNDLGRVLLACGEIDGALEQLREALRLNPANAIAHNNLGNALLAKGDLAGAEASYRKAIALAPQLAGAHYNLGKVLRERGDLEAAVGSLRISVRLAPERAECWQFLADTLAGIRFRGPDRAMEDDLAACLRRDDVDPGSLALAALSLLRARPGFESRPLFHLLLENAIVPDPGFEKLVAGLRRSLLERAARDPGVATAGDVELACALAQHAFLTEYPLEEMPEETALLESLGAGSVRTEFTLASYAAYRRLATFPGARDLPAAAPESAFARVVRRQVSEPAEERRLRGEIVALTGVDDAVSRAVQAQYEENPYPRWHRAPSVAAFPIGVKLRRLFPQLAPEEIALPDDLAILVAGCGTGRHAAIVAREHPNARILAVDLSETSLAFATRRFREIGIANVRFARADLLRLGELQERFDLIECAGVLHHLDDPVAGWRVLLDLLRPRGFMSIALYSERGRAPIVAARGLIAQRGFPATPAGMRAARAAIMALPESDAARGVLRLTDFYSLSGCRDLLFHAKEHRYAPEKIEVMLRALGLEFLGFDVDADVRRAYDARYPGDPSATSLGNWAMFEAEHPEAFTSMYQFWVRRARG